MPYVATVVTALYQNPFIVPDPNPDFGQESGLYYYYNNMQLISMGCVCQFISCRSYRFKMRSFSLYLKLKEGGGRSYNKHHQRG